MKYVAVLALAALCLAGCADEGSSDSAAPAATSATTAATPSETPTEEPTPSDPVPDIAVAITCDDQTFYRYEEAWTGHYENCEAELNGSTPSDNEVKAIETAYGEHEDDPYDDLYGLDTLYGICAQSGAGAFSYLDSAGSAEQIQEITGALVLCPDHPDKARLKKQFSKATNKNKLEAEGRIFSDGTYRVGKEIKPGTYFTTDVENCYWERTDRNGNPIDNYVTLGAKRVQVTIRSSDYSFTSQECGQWQPVS